MKEGQLMTGRIDTNYIYGKFVRSYGNYEYAVVQTAHGVCRTVQPDKPSISCLTQKARGIEALKRFEGTKYLVPEYRLISQEDELTALSFNNKILRPCPTKPQHGWVPSIVHPTYEQAKHTFKKARELDPNAEFILMNFARGKNFIMTPTSLVIGQGHEGATSGEPDVKLNFAPSDLCFGLGVDPEVAGVEGTPYIEGVIGYCHYLTQLRDGPDTGEYEYINMHSRTLHPPFTNYNIISWKDHTPEEFSKALDHHLMHRESTIIHVPSFTSHYGVQARIRNYPVITTTLSKSLQPRAPKQKELYIHQWDLSMIEKFLNADRVSLTHIWTPAISHGLKVTTVEESRVMVFALCWITCFAVAACIAEHRYYNGKPLTLTKPCARQTPRGTVYTSVLSRSDWGDRIIRPDMVKRLAGICTDFATLPEEDGVGGPRWAKITYETMCALNCMRVLHKGSYGSEGIHPVATKWREHVDKIIHLVHNGNESVLGKVGFRKSDLSLTEACPQWALMTCGDESAHIRFELIKNLMKGEVKQ